MENKRRVGIMGGTFDPIHNGHLVLAERAYEQFNLEHILFLPSGNPPHKRERFGGASDADRLEMVRLAIGGNAHFVLDDEEMYRNGYSYTKDTLRILNEVHPDTEFYFIIGADSLMAFDTWMNPECIAKLCVLVAAVRDGLDHTAMYETMAQLKERYGADVRLLETPELDIASSRLRAWCREGRSLRYYVPDSVYEYISANHLYQE